MFHTEADVVFVKGLKVEAVIGVFDWERTIDQPILIDIALETDIRNAALSDEVKDALSYKEVCDDVTIWCQEIKAQLLEHLAAQLVARLFARYDCQKITLSVAKPTAIQQADAVGVQITRYAKAAEDQSTENETAVHKSADDKSADA